MEKNILNSPYEISLWEDIDAWELLDSEGNRADDQIYYSVEEVDAACQDGQTARHFFKESKILILGADDMTAPQKVFNPTFIQNINGSLGLTFSLYYKYFDNEVGDFVDNPFAPYLFNERKIKVKYKDDWYDFIIKEVQENSDNYTFTYACTGLFANELSKTGFDLEFETELDNNQGTIQELSEKVVEGTDWKIAPIGPNENNSDLIEQTIDEPLYTCKLSKVLNGDGVEIDQAVAFNNSESLKLIQKNDNDYFENFEVINGRPLYFFYSSLYEREAEKPIQFLYRVEDSGYEVDSNYLITNASSFEINPSQIEIKETSIILKITDTSPTISLELIFEPNMRGSKLISKQRTKYVPEIDKYVYLFKDATTGKDIYGYYKTNYLTSASVENLITNGSKFVNTSGWSGILIGDSIPEGATPPTINCQPYPAITNIDSSLTEYLEKNRLYPTLTIDGGVEGLKDYSAVYCSTIKDNLLKIKEFTKGDKFVFRLRAGYGEITDKGVLHEYSAAANKPPFNIKIASYNNYESLGGTQLKFKLGDKYYYKKTNTDGIGYTYTLLKWKSEAGLVDPLDKINYYYRKREDDATYYYCLTNWASETATEKEKAQVDVDGNPYLFKIVAENEITSPTDVYQPGLSYHFDTVLFDSAGADWSIQEDSEVDPEESTLKFRTAILTCQNSVSYSDLYSKSNLWGVFLIPDTSLVKPVYEKTTDEGIRPEKTYFIKDGDNFKEVEAPTVVDIKNYYEVNSKSYIQDVEFFNYIAKSESDSSPVLLGEAPTSTVQDIWYFYDPSAQNEIESLDDVVYEWKGTKDAIPVNYEPVLNDGFEKIRSITISESNRFNIIQTLCETFECWAKFIIEHDPDTGEILEDENHIQKKTIAFKKYIGKDNYAGFHYGINLKQITRTLNSESIVSKTIVKDNTNEHATNGFCSIARGNENYARDNFILNFDYYVNQGLINRNVLMNDLYLNANGYLGYYTKLRALNIERDSIAECRVQLAKAIMELTSQEQVYEKAYTSALEQYNLAYNNLKLYCGIDYNNFNEYILTEDLVRDRSKTYYIKNSDGSYSFAFTEEDINNEFAYALDKTKTYYKKYDVNNYILTADISPIGDKQYYTIAEIADLTSGLPAGALEKDVGGYFETLDSAPQTDKKYYLAVAVVNSGFYPEGPQYYSYKEDYKPISYQDMIPNNYYYEKDKDGNWVEIYYRSRIAGVHKFYQKVVSYSPIAYASLDIAQTYYIKVNGQFVIAEKNETFKGEGPFYEQSTISKFQAISGDTATTEDTLYIYESATYKLVNIETDLVREDYYERLFTDTIKGYIAEVGVYDYNAKSYQGLWQQAKKDLEDKQSEFDQLNDRLNEIKDEKEALDAAFYKKYSRFIQEGSWIDENYIDDNLYYLDAVSVAHDSAFPQTTYNINVVELSALEGFEPFLFKIGDKTYIEDTEFFGWLDDGITPYKEEVVISEVNWNLDDPTQNSITVQNFKTQWEDLFQRITATTQSLQYNTGNYARAGNSFNNDGTLNSDTLQNTFFENSFILSNAKNQSVVIDDRGITITDLAKASNILQLNSSGLAISNDGGLNWTLGITANGINASAITTGYINTQEVVIGDKINPTFRWDKEGINAYAHNGSYFNSSKFVRYDQFGLYGINGVENFNPLTPTEEFVIDLDLHARHLQQVSGEDKIKAVSDFSLTWSGFQLKSHNREDSFISISSDNDIQLISKATERIKIGELNENEFGLRLRNENNFTTLETTDKGELRLSGYIEINPSYSDNVIPYNSRVILGNRGNYEARYNENDFVLTIDTVVEDDKPYYKLEQIDDYFIYKKLTDNELNEITSPIESGLYEPTVKYLYSKIFSVFNYNDSLTALERLGSNDEVLYITDDGYLYAQNAEIEGIIKAREGYLGSENIVINSAGISIYPKNDNEKINPVFYIDDEGNVVFKGRLEGATGSFSGDVNVLRLIVSKNGSDLILSSSNLYKGLDEQPTTAEVAHNHYFELKTDSSYSGSGDYETTTDLDIWTNETATSAILQNYWFFDSKPIYQKGLYSSTFFNTLGQESQFGFFIDPETGKMIANEIALGSAQLTDKIILGAAPSSAYFYNPDKYENKVIESGALIIYNDGRAQFGDTLVLEKNKAYFGLITVDGQNSKIFGQNPYIESANAWTIGVDETYGGYGQFNQLTANNLNVETAVFDTASARLSGGINIFKNGILVENLSVIDNGVRIKCKDSAPLTNVALGDLVFLTQENITISERYSEGMYGTVINLYQDNSGSYIDLKVFDISDYSTNYDFALVMGKDNVNGMLDEWMIGVNATARNINALGLRKNSITFSSISRINNDITFKDEVIIGQIPIALIDPTSTSEETTGGLYATSVFLTGTLTTQYDVTSDLKYAGINTLSKVPFMIEKMRDNDTSPIVFWAGAESTNFEDIQNAPFQISSNGSLYASQGYFTGSIITDTTIEASKIIAATIFGKEDGKALTIQDADIGIDFNDSNGKTIFQVAQDHFFINDDVNQINIPVIHFTNRDNFLNSSVLIDNQGISFGIVNNNIETESQKSTFYLERDKTRFFDWNINFNGDEDSLSFNYHSAPLSKLTSRGLKTTENFFVEKDVYYGENAVFARRLQNDQVVGYDLYLE